MAERYDELVPLLDSSIAQARAAGDSGLLSLGLANRASLELRRGDLAAAEADTTADVARAEPALLVATLVEHGDLDEAEAELAALGPDAARGSLVAAVVRFARARLRVEQGRLEEALADFLAVGEELQRAQVASPS